MSTCQLSNPSKGYIMSMSNSMSNPLPPPLPRINSRFQNS